MSAIVLPFLSDVSRHFNLGAQQLPQAQAAAAPWASAIQVMPSLAPVFSGGSAGAGAGAVHYIAHDVSSFNAGREIRNEEKEEARASTAALVGGIMTVLIAGASALTLRSFCDDRAELQKAYAFKSTINNDLQLSQPGAHPIQIEEFRKGELNYVADKVIEVLKDKTAKSRNVVLVTACALTSAISAFLGGMMSIKWLVTASIISGVAFAAVAAFMLVWYCTAENQLPNDVQPKIELLKAYFTAEQARGYQQV